MKTVHKYMIDNLEGEFTLKLPEDAIVRYADYLLSARKIAVWVEVDADVFLNPTSKVERNFHVYKTGQGIADNAVYVATCLDQYIPETYHIYEIK